VVAKGAKRREVQAQRKWRSDQRAAPNGLSILPAFGNAR
jgi:hypothetical protein